MWAFSFLLPWEGTRLSLSLPQPDGPCLLWGGELKTLGLPLGWLWNPREETAVHWSEATWMEAAGCSSWLCPVLWWGGLHTQPLSQASFSPLLGFVPVRKGACGG